MGGGFGIGSLFIHEGLSQLAHDVWFKWWKSNEPVIKPGKKYRRGGRSGGMCRICMFSLCLRVQALRLLPHAGQVHRSLLIVSVNAFMSLRVTHTIHRVHADSWDDKV